MKKYILHLVLIACTTGAFGQTKGLADELYEEYEPKPYVSGFSFGGSLLSALPLDIDFAHGNFERTLNGEIKRVQWLRISDERYIKEVSSEWERFLNKARYKKVPIEDDNGQDHILFIRGSRTRFDEAHFLIREDASTILLTFSGDFTLTKTLDED
ncbi:hypothetical protein N9W22_03545 [Schleiferiaceae bacterium]|nr:hypothetical protein [Schleiferiaceae bacterium]